MNRHWHRFAVIALLLLTAITYLPALHNGFMWDDDDHLTQNPAIHAPGGLQKIWSSLAAGRYYPLTLTNFWVQRRLWGLNPMPYHAVNIALHAINAALLFTLLRRLNVRGAWVAAALWAAHPVNVESVAWISELKNTQSAFFFFLSLLSFLAFERQPDSRRYALALVCFAGALLSKPSTIVLPFVLLLLAWWQRGKWSRQDLWRAAPSFLMAAAMSLWTIAEQRGHVERGLQDWSLSPAARLVVAGKAIWFYAGKLCWPAELSFIYPRWDTEAIGPASLVPLLVAGVVVVVLIRLRQRGWARNVLFGLGYFVIALLPVLGFFDIYFFRYSFVADHFQHLAGVGVIALASAGGAVFLQRRALQWLLAGVAVTVLAAMSWRRSQVFRSDEALWYDTLARNPGAFIAQNSVGVLLNTQGRYEEAIEHFREALRLKPGMLESHHNLGIALTELGRHDEALAELNEAVSIRPDYAKSHYRLGVLYVRTGQLEKAEPEYRLAIRYDTLMQEPYYELGVVLEKLGRRDEAATAYRDAVRLKPDFAYAHNNLANLLAEAGNLDEAIQHYRRALVADPSLEAARNNLATVLQQAGNQNGKDAPAPKR